MIDNKGNLRPHVYIVVEKHEDDHSSTVYAYDSLAGAKKKLKELRKDFVEDRYNMEDDIQEDTDSIFEYRGSDDFYDVFIVKQQIKP